jgi:hypothetical protein
MADEQVERPARITIEFSPAAPSVPIVGGGGVTPWQIAAAAWELDRMARRYADRMAVPGGIDGEPVGDTPSTARPLSELVHDLLGGGRHG